ncbi:MAG TPA: BatA domain-containing protein, partial [Tepidisphaeraceae bacterium]
MFLNITMLAGIGGALVPLVLHLLSRARYRSVDWGAMMFLESAEMRQRQSTKLKQLLLLLLRMGMIGALAVALARPVVRGHWGGLAQEGRSTAVIIVDRSASMGFDENGRTRLDMAREAVLQILSSLKKGDQAALVYMGDMKPQEAGRPTPPTTDVKLLADEVFKLLKVSYGQANVADALKDAADLLDRYGSYNRELYIVTDRQALTWKDLDSAAAAIWKDRLTAREPRTRFVVIPVGSEESGNVAVESVELMNPPAIVNQAAVVEVTVHNYGSSPRAALPLALTAGKGAAVQATTVTIAPNATETVKLPVRFGAAGSQVITASVQTAGMTSDDSLDAAIDVGEPVKVLIVSGDERQVAPTAQGGQGAFRSESDFLRLALAPYQFLGRKGPDPSAVTVLPAEKWVDQDLRAYQVLVLANVPQFSPVHVRAIERFVYGGGGLLIAPGNLARVENYNSMLYRDGTGIMPALLQPPTANDGSEATALLGINLSHPAVKFLRGRPDPVPRATIGRYFPATRRPDAWEIASYASGKPFLVEATAGRGRVMLQTTPLDADWSTLPLSPFYLPYVQSMVRYLAGGTLARRDLTPGQPIQAIFEEGTVENARVVLPDGDRIPVDVVKSPERTELRCGDTDQPGIYTLSATVKLPPPPPLPPPAVGA